MSRIKGPSLPLPAPALRPDPEPEFRNSILHPSFRVNPPESRVYESIQAQARAYIAAFYKPICLLPHFRALRSSFAIPYVLRHF
eukprot:scaffold23561_cov32-Tisochrysis_lutea.AAC.1